MHRILYVDDEPSLLEITKLFLEDINDFSVDVDTAALHALSSIGTQSYDAIISDYQMPEMDGIAFLKKVREKFGDIPFILFTGRGREEVVIEAINNGADFYLQKGGDPTAQFAELAHKVRQAIARRQAEFSRIESEKRLADIINFLPDATFAIDTSGRVISWNRAIEEMTGVAAADMLGKGDYEYAIPFYGTRRPILINLVFEPDEVIAQKYAHIFHEKDILIADTTLPRPMGRMVTLMGKASPLYNRQGEIVGAIESIRDITELKKAEEGMLSAQKDWETIFRAIGHPTIVLDANNHIIDANDTALKATGKSLDELKGKRCFEIFHGPSAVSPPDGCPFEQLKKTGGIETADMEIEALNGYYHVSCTPVFDAAGRLEKVIHIAMDVTDRRRTQDELRAAYEQLIASQEELKGQFDELELNALQIRESESRLKYMLGFYEKAQQPEHKLLSYAVEGACSVTGSPLAYLAFLNDDESELAMYAWSQTAMKECSMREKPVVYPVEKTGLWGEAVRQRRPVITNDYQAPNPKKKGYPEGHPQIIRHMNIPVMEADHIVIIAGVANKSSNYTDSDIRDLTLLMQSLWQVLKRRRTEEELHTAHERITAAEEELRGQYDELLERKQQIRESDATLSSIFRAAPVGIGLVNNRIIIRVNDRICEITGYSAEELDGKSARILYPTDEEFDSVGREKYQQISKLGTGSVETRWKKKDGSIRDILLSSTPLDPADHSKGLTFTALDITERKQSVEALYEREQLLDNTFSSIRDGISILDMNMTVVRVNTTMEKWYSQELPLVGRKCWEVYHGRTERCEVCPSYNTLQTGKPAHEIVPLIEGGKSVGWVDLYSYPLIDSASGKMTGVIEHVRNITDEKRAQNELKDAYEHLSATDEELRTKYRELASTKEELEKRKQQLEEIAGTVPGVVYQFFARSDGTRGMYFVSRRSEEVLGIGSNSGDFFERFTNRIDSRDREAFLNSVNEAIRLQSQWDFEGRFVKPSGDIIWFHGISRPSVRGNETIFSGVLQDITGRKIADEALRESETKYRTVIEQSQDGIFIAKGGLLVFHNAAFATMTGYSGAELTGKPIAELIAPEDREMVMNRHHDRLKGKNPPDVYEFSVLYHDGMTRIRVKMHISSATIGGNPATIGTLHNMMEERKREEALRESEERYRNLFENNHAVMLLIDPDNGDITDANPAACTYYHWSHDELTKKKIFEINTLPIAEIQAEIQAACTQKRNLFIFKHQLANGKIRDVEVYSAPIRLGGRLLLYSIIFDITERNQAEKALLESKEQYKQIFESFVDLYTQTDKNGIIRVLSPSVSMTGWKPEELIGRHINVLYANPSERQTFLEKLKSEQAVYGFEVKFKRKDGTPFPVSINARMRFTASGEPDGIVGSIRDITESIRARKALAESEMKYRHILENMQDAYFRADKNGNLIMVSPSAARIYRYGSPDEMIGIPAASLYKHPDQRQKVIQQLHENGKITDFTGEGLRKDGTTFWVSLNIQYIIDSEGHIDGTEGIIRDITERVNLEQAMHEINRKLSLLSSITRHDVANQVSVLRGFAKIAMMKKPDPVVVDLLEKIDSTGSVIAHQIAFTRMYQELGMHAPGWHRIHEIVARQNAVGISLSCTCEAEVFSDPMLEKVFFNMVDNAIRHGERVSTITCSCKTDPDGLVITVEDNGVGVPLDKKEKIFDQGYGKHTGFGLFLAREILAITGITICETGLHGKGARFEITVPEGKYRFAKPDT